MQRWTLERKELPLKITWKIAGATLTSKESYFVHVEDGDYRAIGEVAPNTRYGSTPERICEEFDRFAKVVESAPGEINAYSKWLDRQDFCRALRFGLESAWVHLEAQKLRRSPAEFLGLAQPGPVPTSYSLPIMDLAHLEKAIAPLKRFGSLKIKVDAERAADILKEVTRHTSQKLRIDGNESFKDVDSVCRFIDTLKGKNVEFLEQPMPAARGDQYRVLLTRMPFPLIADESVADEADFNDIKKQFSGVNVKMMKAGGYLPAIHLLRGARAHGLKTMLGCMVESSLGIGSAFQLATLADYIDLDSFLFLKKDPFGLMKEKDGVISAPGFPRGD